MHVLLLLFSLKQNIFDSIVDFNNILEEPHNPTSCLSNIKTDQHRLSYFIALLYHCRPFCSHAQFLETRCENNVRWPNVCRLFSPRKWPICKAIAQLQDTYLERFYRNSIQEYNHIFLNDLDAKNLWHFTAFIQ